MIPVCTVGQMRAAEAAAIAAGIGVEELMQRAGSAMYAEIAAEFGRLRGKSATVLVGPGSNGGDGLIVARLLAESGCRVRLLCSRPRADAAATARNSPGIELTEYAPGVLRRAAMASDLVVDALLGIGSAPPLRGRIRQFLRELAGVPAARVALDIPSGVDAAAGAADDDAFAADLTISAGPCKLGVLQFPARIRAGRVTATDIGLGPVGDGHALEAAAAARLLPQRPVNAHKGTFGRVLAVAGSARYRGAAGLVCGGALRGGAGYVELAAPEPVVAAVAAQMLGPTFTVLPGTGPGPESALADATARASALAVGPGLGTGPEAAAILAYLTGPDRPDRPIVLDADALNLIAPLPAAPATAAPGERVLTPHPGEMARLLAVGSDQVQSDRLRAARDAATRAQAVVVLKGAGTIVAHPGGVYAICPLICPALAVAGSGDVLTGLIAALLGSGLSAWDAARLGVYLHARSGQLAARNRDPAGVLAADLPPLLPIAWAELSLRDRPGGAGS